MGKYTTEVKTICETAVGREAPAGFNDVNALLRQAAPLIFNFDFPIWDESYRLTLETKILKHYYQREIGAETVGQWKLWLDERLNLIMPFYNELYRTTVLEYNPLYDMDLTTEHAGDNKRDGNNTSQEVGDIEKTSDRSGTNTRSGVTKSDRDVTVQNTGESHDVHQGGDTSRFSDTPQGTIDDLAKDKYLTNATINANQYTDDNTNKSNQHSVSVDNVNDNQVSQFNEKEKDNDKHSVTKVGQERVNTTESYVRHVFGANGNKSLTSKIVELRDAILNIDKMIIDELSGLFLGLWG